MNRALVAAILMASTALSACASMAPAYETPVLPVAQSWPDGAAAGQTASAADLAWKDVYQDARLQGVIQLALDQNRDLRVAVLNIERARAQYRVQRASSLPSVDAGVSGSSSRTPGEVAGTPSAVESDSYSASLGVTAYELDLFGRVRSLNDAALQTYLATAETRRAVQISLIAETATAWVTLAADQDLLTVSQNTLKSSEESLALTRRRQEGGAANLLEVRQAETLVEQARGDLATAQAQVARDRNALTLLAGTDVPADMLPTGDLRGLAIRHDLPAGVPSEVLARRPDVLSAEHSLRGMNANIGAARAAFFPRITLTASAGSASTELSGLFGGGSGAWSFAPAVSLPIFDGGANAANLRVAKVDHDIALAQYEKTVQTAFREVSDALAVQTTLNRRLEAATRLLIAAQDAERLSRIRYEQGIDSYLVLLDAQRTRYSAEKALVALWLVRAQTSATLYKALGGGATA
ncbi:efflux transporter outer membrane subunit [Caulobacter sp. NIBR1757]|uniref:efflux transporter outer membrane subunit n=1 Tax=Caulobacter sp. NIBR1757 TaxID=3016000 RepID=UPI0022F0CCAD|nr:efflux transporter outer membrane subunit [Caulobacter sp. NIBR1757]WGM38546.1 Toluene efflux pump outer membrane protein TtgC [Caulobacter sp. NIBR1757]